MRKRARLLSVLVSTVMVLSCLTCFPTVARADSTTSEGFQWTDDGSGGVMIQLYQGTQSDVVIPAQIDAKPVTTIGSLAFYELSFVSSIQIPNSVTSIQSRAFYRASGLRSLYIPENVSDIGEAIFEDCDSLSAITVAPENIHFTSQDGVLYDAALATLIAYPAARPASSFAVPTTVTSIAVEAFRGCKALEQITLPDGLNAIGTQAFYYCKRLKSIALPAGVTDIPDEAFRNCKALSSVSIPAATSIGFGCFAECSSLAAISLPQGLTRIGSYAFGVSGLMSISIPASVTTLEGGAFARCNSLVSISVDADNPNFCSEGGVLFTKDKTILIHYPSRKPDTTYSIPEGVTALGREDDFNIFDGENDTLTSVHIPSSLTNIHTAFNGFTAIQAFDVDEGNPAYISTGGVLYTRDMTEMVAYPGAKPDTTYTVPATITILSNFMNARNLTSFQVEEGNHQFKARDGILYSFQEWYDPNLLYMIAYPPGRAMDNLVIPPVVAAPETVAGIEPAPFVGSQYLKSVTIRDGATSVGSHLFANCYGLEHVDIPDGVQRIGLCCFWGCRSLKDLTIPASVTEIEEEAFVNAVALEHITFLSASRSPALKASRSLAASADALSIIPNRAFVGCSSLESVTLPNTIEQIGAGAFSDCSALTSMEIPDSVTAIGADAFAGCTSLTAISVGPGNPSYSSQDGVLYNKDGTTLLQYPAKRAKTTFSVPATVTAIQAGAFADVASLTQLTIPESVTYIDALAFAIDAPEHLTIFGKAGSYAQSFATGLGIPFSTAVATFQVSFDSKGGSAVASADVQSGRLLPKPADPVLAGYTFAGWFKDTDCTDDWDFAVETVTTGITLYAKWVQNTPPAPATYTASFDAQGGSAVASVSVTAGATIAAPAAPTRTGHIFAGWYKEAACINPWNFASDVVTQDTTLFAKWTAVIPVGISCTKNDVTIYGGMNGSIAATASGGNSGTYEFSINGGAWQSSNAYGGLGAGTYTVAVRDANNISNAASVSVTIGQPSYMGSFPANKIPTKVNAGNALKLTPQKAPAGFALQSVSFSSSNSAAATVDPSGTVTFLAGGKATITITSIFRKVDSKGRVTIKKVIVKKAITVLQPVSSITFSQSVYSVLRTKSIKLSPTATIRPISASNKKVKWTSSNPKVATVSSSGVVLGKAAGTVTITCTAQDGSRVSASCIVMVMPISTQSIKLSKTTLTVKKGATYTLKATVLPGNSDFKKVIWASSDPSIASVDSKTGKVKGKAAGTTTITATTADGKSASCTVTIN